MSNKRKRTIRALAAKLNVTYQEADNIRKAGHRRRSGGDRYVATSDVWNKWDMLSPEHQATMMLVQFSPGIDENALDAALWVVLGMAKFSKRHPVTAAIDLLRLRDLGEEERAGKMPDPKLRAKLAGFFGHPGPRVTEFLVGMRGVKDPDDLDPAGATVRAFQAAMAATIKYQPRLWTADGPDDLKAWEENPANFDLSGLMALPEALRPWATAKAFQAEPQNKQAFMILAMFSDGIKQRDLSEAFAVAIQGAEAGAIHPGIVAVSLLQLREMNSEERAEYVANPAGLANLDGFFAFSGRSIEAVLDFMTSDSIDPTDPLAIPAAALWTIPDLLPVSDV